jgi:ABC-type transport system substrate-binding protein
LETGALPGGIWWASCGLTAHENGASYWFDVRNYGAGKPSEVSQLLPAEFDRWYTMQLEVDPDTMRFTCTADGIVVGTIIPADSEALRGASFERQLGSHRVANAYATTYVDSVRSSPRQRASQATVPASPGAPTATIPYMTPMPGADTTTWHHIVFNLDDSIVGYLAVRKAIAYGTDRLALGKAWAPPYEPVILSSYIRPDSPYYAGDANLIVYRFDPDMANMILAEAGWVDENGDGIREGEGTPLRLRYITNQAPQRVALAEAFQDQMQRIGIGVEIQVLSFMELQSRVAEGNFQLAQFAWTEEEEAFIPTGGFTEGCENSYFHSACIPTTSTNWKGLNVGRLQSAEMDRLLEALVEASTFEEKRALLIQTQAVFTRELPMLPLFCNPQE